jgi:hypothetical protein
MSRLLLLLVPVLLGAAVFAAPRLGAEEAPPRPDPLLVSGQHRYDAYVRAERESMRAMIASRDAVGARIHRERLRPASVAAGVSSETPSPLDVVRAASQVLSLDGRGVGSRSLLDLESHAAGAGAAFDGIRDALWARDQGLVGSIDERFAGLRAELDAHRRGSGFVAAHRLRTEDERRLAAALDALAWRLRVAADRLGP